MDSNELNDRQLLFCQFIVDGMNATQAARAAGYSESKAGHHGSLLMKHERVRMRIAQLREARQAILDQEFVLTKKWVIDELVDNVRLAKTPGEDGRLQLTAANNALTLLGKELGMFVDRKEIRTGPLEDVPDDQLDAIIAEAQDVISAAQGLKH